MAGIDKTYVTSWSDYVKVRDWARSVGTVKDDFGNVTEEGIMWPKDGVYIVSTKSKDNSD